MVCAFRIALDYFSQRDLAQRAAGRKRDFTGRAGGVRKDHRPLPAQGCGTPRSGHRRYQARSRRVERGVRGGQTRGASRGSRGRSPARAASTPGRDGSGSCCAGSCRSGPWLVAAEAARFRPGALRMAPNYKPARLRRPAGALAGRPHAHVHSRPFELHYARASLRENAAQRRACPTHPR
jgi:hypothetical protein